MQSDEQSSERLNEGQGLTTEQLAGSGGAGADGSRPVYPGESTGGETADTADTMEEGRDRMRQEADATDAAEAAEVQQPGSAGYGETGGSVETGSGFAGREKAEEAAEAQALLPEQEAAEYRAAWGEIQGRFVDDPQGAVRDADGLVAEVMQTLAGSFAAHKKELEGQWREGEEVATEELRLALQRYRSFFGRLLRT
ncbi:hypothetical protein [Streptomyces sp. NPDC091268]|uniref:hypothetical protein n=1 Tax=Streptomyces sp. NPDC091268 TaxID=3365979 RepID=UPI003811A82A